MTVELCPALKSVSENGRQISGKGFFGLTCHKSNVNI